MTGDDSGQSRRSFLQSTGAAATTALAATATAATTGLAGCSALPGVDDDGANAPDYDQDAVTALVRESFPKPPIVFPVEIPEARFSVHETRARELLDEIPEQPDIPNEAIANRIARERRDLSDHLGQMHDEHTPRERLGRWRYYRSQAAEVWGSYVAATHQYSPGEFQTRYDRLRAGYNAFEGDWNYRGSDPAAALVVHYAIEELVSRGRDAVLSTGPFPTDPLAAVFEAGRMISAHEDAEAELEDARMFRNQYLSGQSGPPSQRLAFAAASERLRYPEPPEHPREPYETALEEGRSALDADVGNGPAGITFEHARRTANFVERDVERALARNDPATATLHAARKRLATRTFRRVVDAIHADELDWPADVVAIRNLRSVTVQTLERAWSTSPDPVAVELAAHATGLLHELQYFHDQDELDDRDLARVVGTLYYARRYAEAVPAITATVVDAITTT